MQILLKQLQNYESETGTDIARLEIGQNTQELLKLMVLRLLRLRLLSMQNSLLLI